MRHARVVLHHERVGIFAFLNGRKHDEAWACGKVARQGRTLNPDCA